MVGDESGARRTGLFRRNRPLGRRHPQVEVGLRELCPCRDPGKLTQEIERRRDPQPAEHRRVSSGDHPCTQPLDVVHDCPELLGIQQSNPG